MGSDSGLVVQSTKQTKNLNKNNNQNYCKDKIKTVRPGGPILTADIALPLYYGVWY